MTRFSSALPILCFAAVSAISLAAAQETGPLPPDVPVPEVKPIEGSTPAEAIPPATALPDETSAEPEGASAPDSDDAAAPSGEAAPLPSPRPLVANEKTDEDDAELPDATNAARAANGPPRRRDKSHETPAAMPQAEQACRAGLRELGVEFEDQPALADEGGCGTPHPVLVSRLPGGVELRPPAAMTCGLAEATARFVVEHAAPLAESELGAPLTAIDQVSGYVCRPRAGTGTLSEHARANALDWGAIELGDGRRLAVESQPRDEQEEAGFLYALRDAACGPFKTVLGPGSDADHADHFHFDMAERRNGGTFCQ